MSLQTRRCRYCGREIAFVRSPNGKYLPLETLTGVVDVEAERLPISHVYTINERGEAVRVDALWVSHFRTCKGDFPGKKGAKKT